jgi:hypothetical protein
VATWVEANSFSASGQSVACTAMRAWRTFPRAPGVMVPALESTSRVCSPALSSWYVEWATWAFCAIM